MAAESRRIARLLLTNPSEADWERSIKDENILQKTPSTARRQARLLRNRLGTLDRAGLELVSEGVGEVCLQALLAAAIRHSRLLGDFLRDVYIEDARKLERHLSHTQWDAFLCECEHRDEAVAGWAPSTREKLFQVIARILAEAKYLDSTRKLGLTPPMLHPKTRAWLKQLGDAQTLALMETHR
jgi:hypothetical protein